jgi:hypothetical protein
MKLDQQISDIVWRIRDADFHFSTSVTPILWIKLAMFCNEGMI